MIPIMICNALALMICCFVCHLEGSLLIKYRAKESSKPANFADCITMKYLQRYASARNRLTDKFSLLYLLNKICLIMPAIVLIGIAAVVAFHSKADALLQKTHWIIWLSPTVFGVIGTAYATTLDKSKQNINHSKVLFGIFIFEVVVAVIVTIIKSSCIGN